MYKSVLTAVELVNALDRIINEKTIRIAPSRKLSVRAVEDEAGLGDGSAYYYQDVLLKIKKAIKSEKVKRTGLTEDLKLKEKLRSETKIKNKYREKIAFLEDRIQLMAKEHNELYQQLLMYKEKADDLESRLSLQ